MVAIASVSSNGSLGKLAPLSYSMNATGAPQLSGSVRSRSRATKLEVAEAFIGNLRTRANIDVDQPGFIESIKDHFESLPSRCGTSGPLASI